MKNLRIDYPDLVRQLLPTHKRQPVRLWWLRGLTAPLATLFAGFGTWRDDQRRLVNVNSQVRVLEGYLRYKYGEPLAIRIVTFDDGLLPVALRSEGDALRLVAGLRSEEVRAALALRGEIRDSFGDADFVVYIPEGIDAEAVRADIERFKQALVTYRIIQR